LITDIIFITPFVVLASLIGQSIIGTTCTALPEPYDNEVILPLSRINGEIGNLAILRGSPRLICQEIMVVWGMFVAVAIFYIVSALAVGHLYLTERRSQAAAVESTSLKNIHPPAGYSSRPRVPATDGGFI
jgi:hypothetical protein